MNIKNEFNPDKVTYSSDIDYILSLHSQDRLIDFLPRLYPGHYVSYGGKRVSQRDILETWIKHFESIDVPYALTAHMNHVGEYLVMWKEVRV